MKVDNKNFDEDDSKGEQDEENECAEEEGFRTDAGAFKTLWYLNSYVPTISINPNLLA